MVKFRYYWEREEIFRKAARLSPLNLRGKRVSIFPDYIATVAKKRAAFSEAKRLFRSCQGIKFGILYPAVLRVTLLSGQEKRFGDPSEAMDYFRKNLKSQD